MKLNHASLATSVHRVGNGVDKTQTFASFKIALQMTSRAIVDNGYGTKAQAQEWAARISEYGTYPAPGGMTYTFQKA